MPKTHRVLIGTILLALLAASGLSSSALAIKKIDYDHSKECPKSGDKGCLKHESISLVHGELFEIRIANTYPDLFTYSLQKVQATANAKSSGAKETVVLRYTHDEKFGGYVVNIKSKGKSSILGDATIVILVKPTGWQLGFSGGFTASSLTSSVYAIDADTVAVDTTKNDLASLGLASFVTVSHATIKPKFLREFGLSFGLGLETGGGLRYFFGPSWLWGDKGAITAGVALGKVNILPAGVLVGDTVTDSNANILNNLGQRTEIGFFVSVSYLFIGGAKEKLQKPFSNSQGDQKPEASVQ